MHPERPPGQSLGHSAYRPDIDGLRAVAILAVLGFHAFPAWVPGGFVGVDVFFVISGFLISGLLLGDLESGRFSLADFYARRIRRIYPALILVLLTGLGAGYFLLWPGEYRNLGKHVAGGASFIVNFLLWGEQGYFEGQAATKPLLHLWSLGVEEQFYIVWPLLLAAAWKWKHRAGWLIATLGILSLGANLWLAARGTDADFYSPLSRFWELMAGGGLAWMARAEIKLGRPALVNGASVTGAALIAAAVFLFDKDMDYPGWRAMLPVAGACLLIAAGGKTGGGNAFFNRRVLAARPVVAVGLISYPLYLWHWPLLSFAQILSGEPPARWVRIGIVAASFVLAALTYLLVEKPIRRASLLPHTARHKAVALLLVMLALGAAGAGIWAAKGIPMRFADGGTTGEALDGDRLIAVWQQNVRMHECHLQDLDDARGPECVEAKRPLLMLWGDSHAAALYPGLRTLQASTGGKFGIAQMTQAGCPPVFDVPNLTFRHDCNDLNESILRYAETLRPAVILLSAAWRHHDYPMTDADMIALLNATVATIRKALPDSHVIVVGPDLRWATPLPSIYRRALTIDKHDPPAHMADHLDPAFAPLDKKMAAAMRTAGVDYLSPQSFLCDAHGCLTRFGDGLDSLTFIDEEHVTQAGSDFIAEKYAPVLLPALGIAPKN
jgi:peptidoglycan/LPS O-acetylase OafA/YrhL